MSLRARSSRALRAAAPVLASLAACGGEGGVVVETYGESYIEEEIPAAEVEDGYRIEFTKFLVVLSDVEIASAESSSPAKLADPLIFDLARPGPHVVHTFEGLEARRHERVSARIAPASGARAGSAAVDDVDRMNEGGFSVLVEGRGEKGSTAKSFRWAFTTATHYTDCHDATGGAGVVVPSGSNAEVQLTIHGDHLFYDGLENPDARVRFQAIADADRDGDGEVTQAELAAVDLSTLPLGQYGTAGDPDVVNLGQFVASLSRTLLHFQGEGECGAGP